MLSEQGEGSILHAAKRKKANWTGQILQMNHVVKHAIEGKIEGRIEVKGRQGRRYKQLLDDINWRL